MNLQDGDKRMENKEKPVRKRCDYVFSLLFHVTSLVMCYQPTRQTTVKQMVEKERGKKRTEEKKKCTIHSSGCLDKA